MKLKARIAFLDFLTFESCGWSYSLMRKKIDKTIFKNCISEKFRKQSNFLICISSDYVFHESPKKFWKNNHFENMRASFLRRCQNSLC